MHYPVSVLLIRSCTFRMPVLYVAIATRYDGINQELDVAENLSVDLLSFRRTIYCRIS